MCGFLYYAIYRANLSTRGPREDAVRAVFLFTLVQVAWMIAFGLQAALILDVERRPISPWVAVGAAFGALAFNYWTLARRACWTAYARRFERLAPTMRALHTAGAWTIIVLSFVLAMVAAAHFAADVPPLGTDPR